MFQRQLVTKLNRLAKQFPVLAITGSRQIGKSTLARMYAEAVGKELVFYDLENPTKEELKAITDTWTNKKVGLMFIVQFAHYSDYLE